MLSFVHRVIYRHWQRFHGVRRLELATLCRYLELSRGQRILDIGSGKGAFPGRLSRGGLDAVGVDPSLSALSIAKRWVDRDGLFLCGAGEGLPLAAASFDRAVSVCVLEHTKDDAAVLAEVRRVLRPDGVFALTVDCLNSPLVDESFRQHHVAEYRCNQLYDDVRIRRLLMEAGFDVLESRYLFTGRLAIAILRWGSRFHYRGPFILLFPVIYPFLWMDHILGRRRKSGMILAVKARKASVIPSSSTSTVIPSGARDLPS